MNTQVTIVIPNYNGKHFMKSCLASLSKQTYRNFDILVVDNASTDGTADFMNSNYPDIKMIQLDKNYGFSKAVNVGIKQSNSPYVILLNNDTTVDSNYISEMVKYIESDDKIFSVSSKMIQMYHPDLIDSAGDFYTILGWGVCRGCGRSTNNYTKKSSIFTACAGAAIYRKAIFDQIGYFDENHFAYLEDIDIGYRARIYGYKNIYCPSALVYHVGSGTSGSKYNDFKVRLSARNNVYIDYKNMPLIQLIFNFIPLFLGYFIKYLFFLKKGFGRQYLQGINEGLKTIKQQTKVKFHLSHLYNYIKIEFQLIWFTVLYIIDWFKRKMQAI